MKRFVLATAVLLGVLIPVTFVPAQRSDTPEPSAQELPTITIRIVADADSVIAVPSSVTVKPGQMVEWICELGEWEVKFKSGEPFGEDARNNGIKGRKGSKTGKNVRGQAHRGNYKYDIKVKLQGGRNLTADPEIVVEAGEADAP